jgi:transposase
MTDAEILTLVDRLERCLLGKEEFHHRDHLTVAVVYLYASDLESAMDRMRASLKRFAAHHSVPKLYHETLTRFWLLQVERHLDRSECLSESVRKVREQLNDKNLVFNYYSRERIESKEAREKWIEPDLKPLVV